MRVLPIFNIDPPIECSICLEPMINAVFHENGEQHPFHLACVQEWFQYQHTCPTCRIPIENIIVPPPLNERITLARLLCTPASETARATCRAVQGILYGGMFGMFLGLSLEPFSEAAPLGFISAAAGVAISSTTMRCMNVLGCPKWVATSSGIFMGMGITSCTAYLLRGVATLPSSISSTFISTIWTSC